MRYFPKFYSRACLFAIVTLGVVVSTLLFAIAHEFDIDRRVRFFLVDQNGQVFTQKDLLGHWSLVYFGFTHCPMVCPIQMTKISRAMEHLEQTELGTRVTPIFITVDPERDNASVIADYLGHFHPRFIGLTGTPAALQGAANAFNAIAGTSGGNDGHDEVMHSSVIYIVDPAGRMVDYLPYEITVPALVEYVLEFAS